MRGILLEAAAIGRPQGQTDDPREHQYRPTVQTGRSARTTPSMVTVFLLLPQPLGRQIGKKRTRVPSICR